MALDWRTILNMASYYADRVCSVTQILWVRAAILLFSRICRVHVVDL